MPTSSSTRGWSTLRPKPGRTSTTKMALPRAIGSVSRVERSITPKDVTMSGSAPNLPSEGTQLVPVTNWPKSRPSTRNAERPCWATNTMRVTTIRATRATQAPVRVRPTFSSLRFGSMRFDMCDLSENGKCGAPPMRRRRHPPRGGRDYLEDTLPLASLATFMSEAGMKPSSSTRLPWTSSDIMKSRKARVASSASLAVYMCS